jgi:hypothetical protein
MLETLDSSLALLVATAAAVCLLASGALLGALASRRAARELLPSAGHSSAAAQPVLPLRELERCLELADCVGRDADAVVATLVNQSPGPSREMEQAVQQLIRTANGLVGRVRRLSQAARSDLSPSAAAPQSSDSLRNTQPSAAPPRPGKAAACAAEQHVRESRRFVRRAFRGQAKATIYPLPAAGDAPPQECTVSTRDLSCGGIGIAHSEPLFPRQRIRLRAAGKLLIGEVRWCRRVKQRYYLAGCQLLQADDDV